MDRRTRPSLGIPARTLVACVFALGGATMVATSWFVDSGADNGWMWTGIGVLGAAAWTYLVREDTPGPRRRPDADAETRRRTDTNVNA